MTDDSLLSGSWNAALFTALGVVALAAGFTVLDGWLLRSVGAAIVVGGCVSLGVRRLDASPRAAAAPAAFSVLVVGGIVALRGARTGSVLWTTVGIGVAVALALLMVFPNRVTLACGLLTVTFGGAGALSITTGALPTGLVLVGWAVGFAWVGYQNRPAAAN